MSQSESEKICLFPLHEIISLREAADWLGVSHRRLLLLFMLGAGPQTTSQTHWWRQLRKSDIDQYAKQLFEKAGLPQQDFVLFRKERNNLKAKKPHPFMNMVTRDELHRALVSGWGKLFLLLGLGTIMFSHSPWLHHFF